jgi:pSer/pThr/pTyr-binding forkhead associated (FHA) protein
MSVNVRLCGSIPREDMIDLQGALCGLKGLSSSDRSLSGTGLAVANGCGSELSTLRTTNVCEALNGVLHHNHNIHNMTGVPSLVERSPLVPLFEPPSWAVPAKGEARLEVSNNASVDGRELSICERDSDTSLFLGYRQPVCEALGRQPAVDLTRQAFYRVGRSPSCDVQLMHGTSSRRHAMLFHHANGSCYIVDCGSAHGTFVNGRRISSPVNGGMVIPYKVRRGALIRFGGPGAPCFVLKSFSFHLNDISEAASTKTLDTGELVRRNTRLNALGRTAAQSLRQQNMSTASIFQTLSVSSKRSFESLASSVTLDYDEDEPALKRLRCSSPPMFPEEPLRLVSPDLAASVLCDSSQRHVSFSKDPPQTFYPALVTPNEELSSEEDS